MNKLGGEVVMNNINTICPVCEKYSFEYPDDYDICPICGGEKDGIQREQKDYWGGANRLSVNEAKTVHSLLQDKVTELKASEIIAKYERRNSEIHFQFRGIDHRSKKGKECQKAFVQAHNDFVIELRKPSETR